MATNKIISVCVASLFLVVTACTRPPSGRHEKPPEVPTDSLALYAVVEATDMEGHLITRGVHVVIDAFDNQGKKGMWIDTDSPAGGVARPYPKVTDEVTRYQHPIYYDPRLVITASITVTMLGKKGDVVQCYFLGPGGIELAGTFQQALIPKNLKESRMLITVFCHATSAGIGT